MRRAFDNSNCAICGEEREGEKEIYLNDIPTEASGSVF